MRVAFLSPGWPACPTDDRSVRLRGTFCHLEGKLASASASGRLGGICSSCDACSGTSRRKTESNGESMVNSNPHWHSPGQTDAAVLLLLEDIRKVPIAV